MGATMPHGAHTTDLLTATGLTPGKTYGLAFEWQGATGGIQGGFNNQTAGTDGRLQWPTDPTILTAVAHHEGPGTLTLDVTDADGNPLGGNYHIAKQYA